MARIARATYLSAATRLLEAAGFRVQSAAGRLHAQKKERRLFVDVAGKNLPYTGKKGSACFEWETWLQPDRLGRVEKDAAAQDAEPWIAFCYAILEDRYQSAFGTTVSLTGLNFGARMIGTPAFRANMVTRSPSWGEVNLPRRLVLQLTSDPSNV